MLDAKEKVKKKKFTFPLQPEESYDNLFLHRKP